MSLFPSKRLKAQPIGLQNGTFTASYVGATYGNIAGVTFANGNIDVTGNINTSGTIRGSTFTTNYIGASFANIGGVTFANGQITSASTTTSSGTNSLVTKDYIDDDTPPPVLFGKPFATSSNIYIPIVSPIQTRRGGFPQPYPTILGCKFLINETQIVDSLTVDSQSKPFDYRFVNPLSTESIPTTQPTGLIISKTQSTNLIPSNQTFYLTSSTPDSRYCIVYNMPSSSLSTIPINTVNGFYRNYNPYSTISDGTTFTDYNKGYAPSAITTVTIDTTAIVTATTVGLIVETPTSTSYNTDTNTDESSGITITSYVYNYSSPGSINRYNAGLRFELLASNLSSSSNILSISSLYPDCSYELQVYAVNSIDKYLSNPALFSNVFTTQPPTILNKPTIDSLSYIYSLTLKSCYRVDTGDYVSIYKNAGPLTISTASALSLNYNSDTKGNLGVNKKLMNLTATLSGNTVSKVFNGFTSSSLPIAAASSVTSALTLNYGSITDQYTPPENQGFYLQLNGFNITINSPLAFQLEQTLNITQQYYNIDGTVGQISTKPIKFYYDNLSGLPVIDSATTTINNTSICMIYVSGIKILKSNPKFTVTTNVTNLFQYFYEVDPITYTIADGALGTANETNLTTNKNPATTAGSQITFTNNSVDATVAASYNTKVTINITATNINNSTTTPKNINVICDYPSYALLFNVNSTLKVNVIQIVKSTVPMSGYRVWSGPAASFFSSGTNATYIPVDYGYNTNTYSYSTIQYSHNWDICSPTNANTGTSVTNQIDARQELIVANGAYRSKGISNDTYYINYSNYQGTNPNYSLTQPTYRFATFAWKYDGTNPQTINRFIFTFKNFTPNIGLTNNAANGAYSFNSDSRIFLHYRIEDTTSGTTILPTTPTKFSTLWIDGNSKFGTSLNSDVSVIDTNSVSVSSVNYYSSSDYNKTLAPTSIQYSIVATDLVATVSNIAFGPAATNFNIYCRIGLPTSSSYSFTDVQLNFAY